MSRCSATIRRSGSLWFRKARSIDFITKILVRVARVFNIILRWTIAKKLPKVRRSAAHELVRAWMEILQEPALRPHIEKVLYGVDVSFAVITTVALRGDFPMVRDAILLASISVNIVGRAD